MEIKKMIFSAASAVLTVGVAFAISGGTSQVPVNEDQPSLTIEDLILSQPEEIGPEQADSTVNGKTKEEILEQASESYKRVRRMQYEDADPDMLYAAAYACYLDNIEGLEVTEPNSVEWRPCRSRLVDINRILEEAAFYYSSKGNNAELTKFAQAYVDTQLLESMKNEKFQRGESYPLIVYIAASGAYNIGDYSRALKYFREYLNTGDTQRREQIYVFLGQATLKTGDYGLGISALMNGVELYPTNYQMILLAIQNCIDGKQTAYLQKLLDRALLVQPSDEQILNLQAAVYQRRHEFEKALDLYQKLLELKPQSLNVVKEMATCYFNLGVSNYNKAIQEENEKEARRYKRKANDYFDSAILRLNEVLINDPLSLKYLKALAVCYGCIDDIPQFEKINDRIMALGDNPVKTGGMPSLIAMGSDPIGEGKNEAATVDVPLYSEFGTDYVTPRVKEWIKKGEFETEEQFHKRVTDQTIKTEISRLNKEAQDAYLKKYSGQLVVQDLSIEKPYDTENQVYQIESSFGPITVKVPLANHEAEVFRSNFGTMSIRNPQFHIKDNKVQVASITFVAPDGKTYESAPDLAYRSPADVYIDPSLLNISEVATSPAGSQQEIAVITVESDVDKNIPVSKKVNDNTVALIIANEHYHNVANVESALHDGKVFREYVQTTLGVPASNILYYPDATLANMITATDYLGDLVKSKGGDVDIIVYYSGHGMPDESTKEAFIVPVDATDRGPSAWYSLNKFYNDLSQLNANSVIAFIDACFSGSQRDGEILMKTRGIAIKPVEAEPVGNMYILTATSGNETAMPYKEMNHGMFTYFLLKKLQESKGNVTLQALSDYVIDNVKRESMRVNHKLQTPTVSGNGRISGDLANKKLVK